MAALWAFCDVVLGVDASTRRQSTMSGIFHFIMRRQCAFRCACMALVLLVVPAAADDLVDRLIGDLLGKANDGRLEQIDFVGAALIAGGVADECELSGWLDVYSHHRDALLGSLPSGPSIARLRAIHDGLHEQIFKGRYDAAASDLRLALAKGDFNCLSALVLFVDLCESADLPMEIWLTRGHVFLRVVCDAEVLELEPATPQWNIRMAARRLTLSANRAARRITPIELLGKFFYNRGVELLKDRQFAEGIELLTTSLALDPADVDARANLVAGLNNWAVDHLQSSRYDDAAALIEQGLSLDPAFAPLIANEQVLRAKLGK